MGIKQSKINRQQAIDAGEKTYISATICKHCQSYERYVSNSSCVQCTKIRTINRDSEIAFKYNHSKKGKKTRKNWRRSKVNHAIQNKWVKKDYVKWPDKYKDRFLKHNYGITIDQYNEMFNKQNGC